MLPHMILGVHSSVNMDCAFSEECLPCHAGGSRLPCCHRCSSQSCTPWCSFPALPVVICPCSSQKVEFLCPAEECWLLDGPDALNSGLLLIDDDDLSIDDLLQRQLSHLMMF